MVQAAPWPGPGLALVQGHGSPAGSRRPLAGQPAGQWAVTGPAAAAGGSGNGASQPARREPGVRAVLAGLMTRPDIIFAAGVPYRTSKPLVATGTVKRAGGELSPTGAL